MARLKGGSTVGYQPIETTVGAQGKADTALTNAKSYTDTKLSAYTVNDLADVVVTGQATNQVLQYNGTNWVNSTLNLTTTVSSLSDVTIASAAANQYLMYNGTRWVNSALPISSTTGAGIVQLNSATNSTVTNQAATPSAVKSAYDLANTANTTANTANSTANTANATANAALPKAGGTMTGSLIVQPTSGNAAFEIGTNSGVTTTPFIDFHSGATWADYDARIIASGGNGALGGGVLGFSASKVEVSNVFNANTTNGRVIIPVGTQKWA